MGTPCAEPRLPAYLREAWERHQDSAVVALEIVAGYAPNLPRVPGVSTVLRLAHRLNCGRTVESAAAAEYLYRWNLALDALNPSARGRPNPFAAHYAPHTLGL